MIIGFALREMFHDLFHPTEGGSLSNMVSRNLFDFFRRWRNWLPVAGPLALVTMIFSWAILLALGFALVYWAVPGSAYRSDPGMNAPDHSLASALFFSLEAMTTLGLGDVKPVPDPLRLLVTFHTLIGFALVTASVTWVVLIYPALARTRTLARTVSVMVEAENATGINVIDGISADVLAGLTESAIRFRIDLVHFPITYYFHADSENASAARAMGHLVRFSNQGAEPHRSEQMRFAAVGLSAALDDCADVIGDHAPGEFEPKDRDKIFRAYAEHHSSPLQRWDRTSSNAVPTRSRNEADLPFSPRALELQNRDACSGNPARSHARSNCR